jgi:hypothetical protein
LEAEVEVIWWMASELLEKADVKDVMDAGPGREFQTDSDHL